MTWKTKALIQRVCAAMPVGGQATYFQMQRRFGAMRKPPDPCYYLRAIEDILKDLQNAGLEVQGRRVMEVGTGWRAEMPLYFYLLGAASVDTFDLHRYLRPELALASIRILLDNEAWALERLSQYGDAAGIRERWETLRAITDLTRFFAFANIRYHAPADASKTPLATGSIDLHFSYTVCEHIPYDVLAAILHEASRVLSPAGVACHQIDLSDHFAHSDPSISNVNFLQFEEADWRKYNDNQFAYHNRLRVGAYEELYRKSGHQILNWWIYMDPACLRLLDNGFPLASIYRDEDKQRLATTHVRVLSRGSHPS